MSSKSNLIDIVEDLILIQHQLFTLGSDLVNPQKKLDNYPRITEGEVTFLENCIDKFDKELEPLRAFILPGGTIEGFTGHVIRTVTRRGEIKIVDLYLNNEISKYCFVYVIDFQIFFLFWLEFVIEDRIKWILFGKNRHARAFFFS